MADESESTWQDDLRVFSCHAYQCAGELLKADGDPQLLKIAATLIGATGVADLGQANDPKIWAAYQAGLLATAVVKDAKGRALFSRLSEMESIDAGRKRGGEKTAKWTADAQSRAEDLFREMGKLKKETKYIRIAAKLKMEKIVTVSPSCVKSHLTKTSADKR